MARDPIDSRLQRAALIATPIVLLYVLIKGLEWMIGWVLLTALFLIVAWVVTASIVGASRVRPAFAGLLILGTTALYAALRQFVHLGDLTKSLDWTGRGIALCAIASVAALPLAFQKEDKGGLRPAAVLFVFGVILLCFVDSRFLFDAFAPTHRLALLSPQDLFREPPDRLPCVAVLHGFGTYGAVRWAISRGDF